VVALALGQPRVSFEGQTGEVGSGYENWMIVSLVADLPCLVPHLAILVKMSIHSF
jgi:hypothetical protein